jgi:hypothetical protein
LSTNTIAGKRPQSKKLVDDLVLNSDTKVEKMPPNPTFYWLPEDIYMARHPGRKSIVLTTLEKIW